MISWVDGQVVWGGCCLPRRSGCAVISSDAGCADLSRGGDRATGSGQGACPTGQGNPGEMDDAARAGEAPCAGDESEEARRLADMAPRQGCAGLHQGQEGAGHRGRVRGGACRGEPMASVVRHRRDRGALASQGTWSSAEAQPDATRGAHAADRGGAAGRGLRRRHLDGPSDRRPDPQEVRRSVPQSPHPQTSRPITRLDCATGNRTAGTVGTAGQGPCAAGGAGTNSSPRALASWSLTKGRDLHRPSPRRSPG